MIFAVVFAIAATGLRCQLEPRPLMIPLRCINICCRRSAANSQRHIGVEDFSATFKSGEITAFHGSDSHGGEHLLSVLGMIEKPDAGSLEVLNQNVSKMSEADAARLRDTAFGYLFTHPHLLPSFTVAENVAMPFFRICGQGEDAARERTLAALDFVGTASLHAMLVGNLDDATQWKVAFARAIVHSPAVLVAVSPPSGLLMPFARRFADSFGAVVLWNATGNGMLPMADCMIELDLPSSRCALP